MKIISLYITQRSSERYEKATRFKYAHLRWEVYVLAFMSVHLSVCLLVFSCPAHKLNTRRPRINKLSTDASWVGVSHFKVRSQWPLIEYIGYDNVGHWKNHESRLVILFSIFLRPYDDINFFQIWSTDIHIHVFNDFNQRQEGLWCVKISATW